MSENYYLEPMPPAGWHLGMEDDGEYTGPGDNPPGYAGDWIETSEIYDNRTGELVCECETVEQARALIEQHNGLQAEVGRLRDALIALVAQRPAYISTDNTGQRFCRYCHMTGNDVHRDSCPVVAARKLLE